MQQPDEYYGPWAPPYTSTVTPMKQIEGKYKIKYTNNIFSQILPESKCSGKTNRFETLKKQAIIPRGSITRHSGISPVTIFTHMHIPGS